MGKKATRAAINGLQNQISGLNNQIGNYKTENTQLKEKVAELEKKTTTLFDENSVLVKRTDSLTSELSGVTNFLNETHKKVQSNQIKNNKMTLISMMLHMFQLQSSGNSVTRPQLVNPQGTTGIFSSLFQQSSQFNNPQYFNPLAGVPPFQALNGPQFGVTQSNTRHYSMNPSTYYGALSPIRL